MEETMAKKKKRKYRDFNDKIDWENKKDRAKYFRQYMREYRRKGGKAPSTSYSISISSKK